ncbi:MAG: DUF5946 family protein [Bacteroidota bacterium]
MTLSSKHFDELSYYTFAHPDANYFIHQLVVDAQTAQTADNSTKKIGLVFAVVGLYLLNEKGYTGRKIQQAHAHLSQHKEALPEISLPTKRGDITIEDVLASTEDRDEQIKAWSASVWQAYEESWEVIRQYCERWLPGL